MNDRLAGTPVAPEPTEDEREITMRAFGDPKRVDDVRAVLEALEGHRPGAMTQCQVRTSKQPPVRR